MPIFKIEVSWTMTDLLEVEADSKEKAVEIAQNGPLPNGSYLDDSFSVDSINVISDGDSSS